MTALETSPNLSTTTRPLVPLAGTSLDPMVEEISWRAWKLVGADHHRVTEHTVAVTAARLRRLAETIWSAGRAVVICEVEVVPVAGQAPSVDVRLGVGRLGSIGSTASEVDGIGASTHWISDDHGALAIEPCDPRDLLDRPDTAGWHNLVVRQQVLDLEVDDQTVEVISRFNPMVDTWTQLLLLAVAHGRPIRIRGTVLATELSTFDRLDIGRRISALHLLGDGAALDTAHLLERAKATMLDLQASFASPLFIGEYAVTSSEPIPDTVARGFGTSITSETDVLHLRQGTVVAGQTRLLGGFEIERDVDGLDDALSLGLPLRGGLRGRDLRDLVTLTECPIGLPVPPGRPLPGIAVNRTEKDLVARLSPASGEDPIGSTPLGAPVGFPHHLRSTHLLVVGTWGAGKSTLMSHRIVDALRCGRSFLLLDPHGDLADHTAAWAAQIGRPIHVLEPGAPDTDTFSPVDRIRGRRGHRGIDRQISRFADALGTAWDNPEWHGPRGRAIAAALLEVVAVRGLSLEAAVTAFNESSMADHLDDRALSPLARSTLLPLVGVMAGRDAGDVRNWVTSKFHALVSSPANDLFELPGQGPTIDDIVASDLPIIVNLRALGGQERFMLGHLLLESALSTVMLRRPDQRRPFDVFVDEAHLFPTAGLRTALTEGRKFDLGLVLASQSLAQFDGALGDVALAAGTVAVFRPSPDTVARTAQHLGLDRDELIGLRDLEVVLAIRGEPPLRVDIHPYRSPTGG